MNRREFLSKLVLAGGLATPAGRAVLTASTQVLHEALAPEGVVLVATPEVMLSVPVELLEDSCLDLEAFLAREVAASFLEEWETEPSPFGNQLEVAFRRAMARTA
jgi:hypothetical protein